MVGFYKKPYTESEKEAFTKGLHLGISKGRTEGIEEFYSALRQNPNMPNWCYELVREVKTELLKENK